MFKKVWQYTSTPLYVSMVCRGTTLPLLYWQYPCALSHTSQFHRQNERKLWFHLDCIRKRYILLFWCGVPYNMTLKHTLHKVYKAYIIILHVCNNCVKSIINPSTVSYSFNFSLFWKSVQPAVNSYTQPAVNSYTQEDSSLRGCYTVSTFK
jgi:hypothetical protein